MKIRSGYVSNSSSTSFVLFGTSLSCGCEELDKLLGDECSYNGYETAELLREKIKEKGLELDVEGGYDYEYLYIGKNPLEMNHNQTMGGFQKSIAEDLKKLGIEKKAAFHEECYYNG